METKKYKYSAAQMLMSLAWLSFLEVIMYITLITRDANSQSWWAFGLASFVITARLSYLCTMYYIPCLRDKTALELDKDRLQLFIKGKLLFQISRDVAYWADIEDIDYTSPSRSGAIISFKMKDGSAFGFYTTYISGNDKDIYNTIMEYFEKYKRV